MKTKIYISWSIIFFTANRNKNKQLTYYKKRSLRIPESNYLKKKLYTAGKF